MAYHPDFAALLDQYLSARERSGAWLAQRLGLNPATISRWRNGESRPNRPEVLIQIADLLHLAQEERNQLVQAAGYSVTVAQPIAPPPTAAPPPNPPPRHDSYPTATFQTSPRQPYPATYRQTEIATLAQWVEIGASGILLGLAGSGVSTLLRHLIHNPALLTTQRSSVTPIIPVWIELQPAAQPTMTAPLLYRLFLRGILEAAQRSPTAFPAPTIEAAHRYLDTNDPIRLQSSLTAVLAHCQAEGQSLLVIIDRLDRLTADDQRQLGDTLRALRDQFRQTLLLLMGMRLTATYLDQLFALGDLGRLLSTHSCIVGGLSARDSQLVIDRRTRRTERQPTALDRQTFLALSAGYPTLLKAVIEWWMTQPAPPPHRAWQSLLLQEMGIQLRLREIWRCLSPQEQAALRLVIATPGGVLLPELIGERLVQLGLCCPTAQGWQLAGTLLMGLG